MTTPQPNPTDDLEAVARLLWERFAPSHEVEWPSYDASEYRLVAKDILALRPAGVGEAVACTCGAWCQDSGEKTCRYLERPGGGADVKGALDEIHTLAAKYNPLIHDVDDTLGRISQLALSAYEELRRTAKPREAGA